MKINKKELLKFWWPMGIAIALMALSAYLCIGKFQEIKQSFLNANEANMRLITQTVDGNLNEVLNGCVANMDAMVNEAPFRARISAWRADGNPEVLKKGINNTPIVKNGLASTILALYDGNVMFSSKDDVTEGYCFTEGTDFSGITQCILPDGSSGIAVLRVYPFDIDNNVYNFTFAAIINPDVFFFSVYDGLSDGEWMLLYSPRLDLLIRSDGESVFTDSVLTGDKSAYSSWVGGAADMLLENGSAADYSTVSYSFSDEGSDANYDNTMIICPQSASKNGDFSVGFVKDFTDFSHQTRMNSVMITLYAAMFTTGVAIVVFLAIKSTQRINEAEKEVETLRRKNDETEKLLVKTNELAHHQRLETIGVMTAGIAHEFNNLMTPIMSCSMMSLEQLEESSPIYDNLVEIYEASRKAKTLVNRLSSVSGKGSVKSEKDIRPAELINKVIGLTATIKPKSVTVCSEVKCTGKAIHGDETQLVQLFLNLIINAYHAMGNGGELFLTADEAGDNIVFRVKDTGCGIPEEVRSNIFEPFFTTRDNGKGTGLGLAIASQVVASHKGIIDVESEVGKGTTFIVSLPYVRTADSPKEKPAAEPVQAQNETPVTEKPKPCTALMIIPQKT